jgi:tRNA (guanine37-N1)-methyltransferase
MTIYVNILLKKQYSETILVIILTLSKFYTMRFDILTILPDLLEGPFKHSILKRAIEKKIAEVHIHNIRDYSTNKHKQVDDYAYGGEAGMVMAIEPIDRLISELKSQRNYDEIIFLTPDGEKFNQQIANSISIKGNIILLCGHYKGIDQRIRDHFITREISIGDYVLSGGELAAAVIVDCVVRLIPGVLSDETSALTDSFQDHLLAPPVYTRPSEYKGWKVPEILLSGNTKEVDNWRMEQSIERTQRLRPDLIEKHDRKK